jgi:hypothetical protein
MTFEVPMQITHCSFSLLVLLLIIIAVTSPLWGIAIYRKLRRLNVHVRWVSLTATAALSFALGLGLSLHVKAVKVVPCDGHSVASAVLPCGCKSVLDEKSRIKAF